MSIFELPTLDMAIKFLIGWIAIFFCLFFFLCWHWSAANDKKERIIVSLMVPLMYSFKLFVLGMIIIGIAALCFESLKGVQVPSV